MANKKRAANRAHGKRLAHREPGHIEKGFKSNVKDHSMHESPASRGAYKGNGPLPGAGQLDLPHNGPGAAAKDYVGAQEIPNRAAGSRSAPRDMAIEREGE